jgi:hypothetical protein
MSLVKSREQKKAMKAIEIMFKGLDEDSLLKQALLTAYAGEDPSILEAMKEQEQRDMEEILKQMELQRQEDVYEQNQNDLVEEKSNDIVDGNNTSNDSINQGHASATLE